MSSDCPNETKQRQDQYEILLKEIWDDKDPEAHKLDEDVVRIC